MIDLSVRLGSVPYYNAAPLVYELAPAPRLFPPKELARRLRAGALDAALVPIAEALLHDAYDLVDHVAIASQRCVYSVILVHEKPATDWQTVALDPDSRTSALLTRVILEKFWNGSPRYVKTEERADARLIIGDPARDFRRANPAVSVIDLAEVWREKTSLPFVFAVWAMRREKSSPALANHLRRTKENGLAARRTLARTPEDYVYLTEHISYELGVPEKQGIARFAQELVDLKVLKAVPRLVWK